MCIRDSVFPEEEWKPYIEEMEKIDRNEYFATLFYAPGIFEQCHYLMEISNCLINFYEEPECMKELIEYITDFELAYAEQVCKYLKPDALFHHDDWGSQISTFISPAMFEEFFLPSYKRLYGFYKDHGVQVIMHHSDSYAATLVPYMIDMGIDIWQGVMRSNNIADLLDKYDGQITFMGGIDSAEVDFPGTNDEIIAKKVREACEEFGQKKRCWIPSASQGLDVYKRQNQMNSIVELVLKNAKVPVVLDADGINVISGNIDILKETAAPVILTPHPGEFLRIGGDLSAGRIPGARDFAAKYGCTVVLKGYRTVTALPDGSVHINTTGGPGMAKGGSGDVLAGMVVSLLGQGFSVKDACIAAVYLHGLAGDMCTEELGEYSVTAKDIISKIPGAVKKVMR